MYGTTSERQAPSAASLEALRGMCHPCNTCCIPATLDCSCSVLRLSPMWGTDNERANVQRTSREPDAPATQVVPRFMKCRSAPTPRPKGDPQLFLHLQRDEKSIFRNVC